MATAGALLQLIALVAGLLAWALALVVLRVSPRAWTSRILAMVLLLEGGLQLATAAPEAQSGHLALATDLGFIFGITQLPWLYLLFLARLDAPLARPLRRARPFLVGVAAGYALLAVGTLALHAAGREPPAALDPLFLACFAAFGVASLYGLAVSVSAYRSSEPGTLARERARAFVLAFGARDGLVVAGIVAFFIEEAIAPKPGVHVAAATLVAVGTILFVPLLAYGILRVQLLDIAARLRWTVSRGAVAAVFLAVFIAASQAVALLVAPRWGVAAGVLAAGLLVLALVPIQRLADRFAARAVPDATPSTATLEARRLEIYQAALEELAPGGEPADAAAERYLSRLRERLELSDTDHAVLARALRSRASSRPGPFAEGELLAGRYRVERALREGGEGRAYLAEDLQLQRRVVLKAVPSSARALREARALAALRHPNVATVHDLVATGEGAVLVMEHVDGGSLREALARGPLDESAWRRVARDVLAALEIVHATGLVHGDVKPSNVLLAADGTAKLADFGTATLAREERTRTAGALEGTPRYMSPEQARGAAASARSDLYAAGLTLLEARGGEGVAPAGDPLAPWFARALERSPSARYASAREMADALEEALAARSRQRS